MGSSYAAGLSEAVTDGLVSTRQAVSVHLTSNFYPPLPGVWTGPAMEAIEAGNDEDWGREIDITEVCAQTRMEPRVANTDADGKITIRAGDLIEIQRLEFFLNNEDEEYNEARED